MAESILELAAEYSQTAKRLHAVREALCQFDAWERAQALPASVRPALRTPILNRTGLLELAELLTMQREALRLMMRTELAGRRN